MSAANLLIVDDEDLVPLVAERAPWATRATRSAEAATAAGAIGQITPDIDLVLLDFRASGRRRIGPCCAG